MIELLATFGLTVSFGVGWYCGYQHYARNVRKAQETVLRAMANAGLRMHRRSAIEGILIRTDKKE